MTTLQLPIEQTKKSRVPDTIAAIVDHFIGEAPGSRLRTHNWNTLRQWAREHPEGNIVVVLDDE